MTNFIAELNNESVFPAAVVRGLLVVQNGLTGTSVRRKIRASVAGKASRTIRFRVEDAEVGKLFATVSDLRTQDLFGLVSYPVSHIAAAELLVPPPDVPAEVLMMEAKETTGESIRYSENEKGNDVSELYDVREYLPGDDVRAIHWKLSAKQEEPILREFSMPLNYSVILLVELAEASADALQSCVAYASALSKGLLEAGVLHTMMWYDRGSDEFVDYNIDRASGPDRDARLPDHKSGKRPHPPGHPGDAGPHRTDRRTRERQRAQRVPGLETPGTLPGSRNDFSDGIDRL